jgi:hypothetical protein
MLMWLAAFAGCTLASRLPNHNIVKVILIKSVKLNILNWIEKVYLIWYIHFPLFQKFRFKFWNTYNLLEIRAEHTVCYEYVKISLKTHYCNCKCVLLLKMSARQCRSRSSCLLQSTCLVYILKICVLKQLSSKNSEKWYQKQQLWGKNSKQKRKGLQKELYYPH